MPRSSFDFGVTQGESLTIVFETDGGDLTGCYATLAARAGASINAPKVIEATSTNGGIALGTDGTLTLTISPGDTELLEPGEYNYNMMFIDTLDQVFCLVVGTMYVDFNYAAT